MSSMGEPSNPVSPTVIMLRALHFSIALKIFKDFPEVEIPINKSPGRPFASTN